MNLLVMFPAESGQPELRVIGVSPVAAHPELVDVVNVGVLTTDEALAMLDALVLEVILISWQQVETRCYWYLVFKDEVNNVV